MVASRHALAALILARCTLIADRAPRCRRVSALFAIIASADSRAPLKLTRRAVDAMPVAGARRGALVAEHARITLAAASPALIRLILARSATQAHRASRRALVVSLRAKGACRVPGRIGGSIAFVLSCRATRASPGLFSAAADAELSCSTALALCAIAVLSSIGSVLILTKGTNNVNT